jgi:hypothetical protein
METMAPVITAIIMIQVIMGMRGDRMFMFSGIIEAGWIMILAGEDSGAAVLEVDSTADFTEGVDFTAAAVAATAAVVIADGGQIT